MRPILLDEEEVALGPRSAGLRMTPKEFDAIEEYDENYQYELVDGVVVVSPIPLAEETGPNELLGNLLFVYHRTHAQGKCLDATLHQQYVRTPNGRRIADRLVWIGLGRLPDRSKDIPRIAVEFVSGGKRDRQRDYVDKRIEYARAKIPEYWIIDRFKRTMTVYFNKPGHRGTRLVLKEDDSYEPDCLPGFKLSVGELLEAADRWAASEKKSGTRKAPRTGRKSTSDD